MDLSLVNAKGVNFTSPQTNVALTVNDALSNRMYKPVASSGNVSLLLTQPTRALASPYDTSIAAPAPTSSSRSSPHPASPPTRKTRAAMNYELTWYPSAGQRWPGGGTAYEWIQDRHGNYDRMVAAGYHPNPQTTYSPVRNHPLRSPAPNSCGVDEAAHLTPAPSSASSTSRPEAPASTTPTTAAASRPMSSGGSTTTSIRSRRTCAIRAWVARRGASMASLGSWITVLPIPPIQGGGMAIGESAAGVTCDPHAKSVCHESRGLPTRDLGHGIGRWDIFSVVFGSILERKPPVASVGSQCSISPSKRLSSPQGDATVMC